MKPKFILQDEWSPYLLDCPATRPFMITWLLEIFVWVRTKCRKYAPVE